MEENQKPRLWIWWLIAVLVIVVYPLSYGPAVWLIADERLPMPVLEVYGPLYSAVEIAPLPVKKLFWSYREFWFSGDL